MPEPFYIVGPTGSGKSAVALELARRTNGELVNADAFQVYAEIPIITAAPTEADLAILPHHLYRCISVRETFSVARYHELATECIEDIKKRGKLPIVVGGSGLYVKALTHGLNATPPSSPSLREQLAQMSSDDAVVWLKALDPVGAEQMNLGNPRYVQRAIEISLLTGQPASEVKTTWANPPHSTIRGVSLQWNRELLYHRINQRVVDMIDLGALAEIDKLNELSPTAAKAIGVEELRRFLKQELTLTEAIAIIQQATRRYAKRQGTWFRREACFTPLPIQGEETPVSIVDGLQEQFDL